MTLSSRIKVYGVASIMILCGVSPYTLATHDNRLTEFYSRLAQIDALDCYGPVDDALNPLNDDLNFIDAHLLSDIDQISALVAQTMVEELFSQYVYRDGSHRSRIYSSAQHRLVKLMKKTAQRSNLLEQSLQNYPYLMMYLNH